MQYTGRFVYTPVTLCDIFPSKITPRSFKDRGALNVLKKLSAAQRKRGVITTSAGNHAQSMAYQGRKLGIEVTVVMPVIAPQVKVRGVLSTMSTYRIVDLRHTWCGVMETTWRDGF